MTNGRTARALFMLPSYALYLGTAYGLESLGASGVIIAVVFVVQGVVVTLILPALLRRHRWAVQLKCGTATAWAISGAIVARYLPLRALPWHQQAFALGAYVAVVIVLYVVFFRRSCPD
jgi:hypothetical protein